ncbi:MAG TPA: hypothetical protein VEJ63_23525 [Planctomycetota bacterium]|nr:hypothetical protein [Planctomycetota bacterium]
MIRVAPVFLVSIAAASLFGAADPDPRPEKQPEIEAAIERGNAVRQQDEIAPGALQSVALIMKRNGVRCGHVYMSMLGARGEGGGTYRFTMQLKAAAVENERAIVIQQDASFLLGADLSLMNGEMTQLANWQDRKGEGGLLSQRLIKLSSAADAQIWEFSEQGPEDTAPKKKGEQKIALKTFKPMPSEVLPMLAALAAKKNNLHPGDGKPLCVPCVNLSELPSINIRPAWITFLAAPKEEKSLVKIAQESVDGLLRIRYLKGGLVEGGLQVQPAAAEEWKTWADYGFNVRQRIVALPKPSEAGVTLENVEPSKLNPREAFEFDAILKSYQVPANKEEPKK